MLLWVFIALVSIAPAFAQAGFFSQILKFISGEENNGAKVFSAAASISMPLLGSHTPLETGTGGPEDESPGSLPSTQDNALISSKNPLGVLPSSLPGEILVYQVKEGDNPSRVAESFGISLNTLLWANNIRNPDLIKIGDELIILPISGVKYEVKKGDTVDSIAKKFKGDPSEILSFNGLAIGEELKAGDLLIIPDGELDAPPLSQSQRIAGYNALPEYRGYYLRPILGGRKSRGIHGYNGIDLANSCGLPVLASAEGSIIITRPSGWNGGYGKYLVMSHPNGTQTLYAHLSSILATAGQRVAQGSQIATIGSTGNSTGCHVHFETRGARNPF